MSWATASVGSSLSSLSASGSARSNRPSLASIRNVRLISSGDSGSVLSASSYHEAAASYSRVSCACRPARYAPDVVSTAEAGLAGTVTTQVTSKPARPHIVKTSITLSFIYLYPSPKSHIRIIGSTASLRHDPIDVLLWVLDVTGLAVDAILCVDL